MRNQLVADDFVGQRADELPAHHALGVDQEGFRRAVDAPVDRGLAFVIGDHDEVGIAELLQPAQRVGVLVLPVEADHAHALGLGEAGQHRVLVAAGRAPAAPDVEQVGRAAQVLRRHQPAGFVQHRQREVRRGFADQRRGQFLAVGVAAEPHAGGEQHRERGENGQRQPATL
ncbi:hypothetical protein CATMIT_01828, partial [Catenibacterium mitsuokai DSM 15897]